MKTLSEYFLKHRTFFILFLIIVLALAFRVGRCITVPDVDKDSVLYLAMAHTLLNDGPNQAFERNPRIPPMYIFAMTYCKKYLGISMEAAGRAVSTIAGTLLVIAVFFMAKLAFKDEKYALIAAFIAATHPFLIMLSEEIMRDSLFVCMASFSLLFVMYGIERKNFLFWFISGFFCAVATMTRSEGIGILFIIPIWFIIDFIFFRKELSSSKYFIFKYLTFFIIFIFSFMLFCVPVQIALSDTSSKWKIFDERTMGYLKSFLYIPKIKK